MKLKFIYALAIAGALSTFTSCSDDDPAPGSSLEQKTYSSNEGLTLNLNGAPLIGKTVTFTPGTDGNATVTLAGEPLDPSQIMGMLTRESMIQTLHTPGVLPGSPSVSIPVELKGDANNCTFEGTNETEYCTYSYSGSVTADNFEFNLSDVKLKNTSLAGTWTVPNFYDDPENEYSGNAFNVARVVWDADSMANILFDLGPDMPPYIMKLPISTVLQMALVTPMFNPDEDGNATTNPLQMLNMVLYNVTLSESGDVTAKYLDVKTGEITTAPTGLAQYVVESDNTIRLFLNPAAIIANSVANTKAKTRAADITIIVENLMKEVIPLLSQGIPVKYGPAIADYDGNLSEDATSFYLDTKTLLPLLNVFAPLFSDEEFVKSIAEEAAKDPSMAGMAGMLPGILNSLPDIIGSTTKVEIGINLKK